VNSIGPIHKKHILFLQGPMGTFFKKMDAYCRLCGAQTYRIGFNMGDQVFSYADNYTAYKDKPEMWNTVIEQFLLDHKIDKIFLFGDCRYYQKIARKVAFSHNIDVFVFEEGYIRPHYITMEKFGVNGFSMLSRDPNFYNNQPLEKIATPEHTRSSKTKMILSAIIYYAVSNIFIKKYPHYRHHRDFSAFKEAYFGLRGIWRKGIYAISERKYVQFLSEKISKQYYFVPLQTHNDFQILQHSNYRSIEKFIIEVLESFAHHAPKDRYLVFKHHPVDRGRKNYRSFIAGQARLLGIEKRMIVLHDVFLPLCLRHAISTITINSTVGMTSLAYGIPTMTLGDAIYDIEGLTAKGTSLKKFWHQYKKPNDMLLDKFSHYLVRTTQLNGSFYGKFPFNTQK